MRKRALLVASVVLLGGSASAGPSSGRATSFEGGEGPVWSPDGTQIAYIGPAPREFVSPKTETFTEIPGRNHVTVVAADGSGSRRVVATAPRSEALDEVRNGLLATRLAAQPEHAAVVA